MLLTVNGKCSEMLMRCHVTYVICANHNLPRKYFVGLKNTLLQVLLADIFFSTSPIIIIMCLAKSYRAEVSNLFDSWSPL